MRFIFIIIFFVSLISCNTSGVFEKTEIFKNQSWPASQQLNFTCEIKDSTKNYYNIFFVLRHKETYHYNNIWLKVSATDGKNFILNNPSQELQLTSNTSWLGTSMDDIIEERIPLISNPIALKKGNYEFTISQIMREDPLENILNAGIRVEKVVQ